MDSQTELMVFVLQKRAVDLLPSGNRAALCARVVFLMVEVLGPFFSHLFPKPEPCSVETWLLFHNITIIKVIFTLLELFLLARILSSGISIQ